MLEQKRKTVCLVGEKNSLEQVNVEVLGCLLLIRGSLPTSFVSLGPFACQIKSCFQMSICESAVIPIHVFRTIGTTRIRVIFFLNWIV